MGSSSRTRVNYTGWIAEMLERRLEGTDVALTEVGFGTASIGNLYRAISDQTAQATLEAAWEEGIRYFDTAPHYGLGLAEIRLGQVLKRHPRSTFVVSTKVGRKLVPRLPPAERDEDLFEVPAVLRREWDFSERGIRECLEGSLERLGLDQVDIVYLHDPELAGRAGDALAGARTLVRLRNEGLTRAVGVGSNSVPVIKELLEQTDIDTAMVAGRFTLLTGEPVEILKAAGSRSVVAAGVFNSGVLASAEPNSGSNYNYGAMPDEILSRAQGLAAAAKEAGTNLPAAAIAYPLRHNQVASAVLGMASVEEVRSNINSYRHSPPESFWAHLLFPPPPA